MKKKDLEFGKYWVLSTAHLTKNESTLLYAQDRSSNPVLVVYPFTEGYWVHVPAYNTEDFKDFTKEVKAAGFSKNFITIIKYALANGCQFIKFDRDGETVSGLKKHNW